ncbi:L,D-transpeptidase [Demequina sediminicola]|uniref:L,D-transpeptidase n=1 Tax=Demequina sediminicola TaxID=1095026 RepID=UPI000782D8B6|nr:L,D-transpeptidase [Demequina sediminicola]
MRTGAGIGILALVVAGCSGSDDSESTSPNPSASTQESLSPDGDSGVAQAQSTSHIATAKDTSLTVYTAPDGDEQQVVEADAVLSVPDETPMTFLVKENQGTWLEVYLPVRPNETTGWVKAEDVALSSTDFSVEVGLDDFSLTVFEGTDAVLTTDIGVGTTDHPTPGGVYYIRELLQPPTDDGPYGTYAYGLSGYSPTLDSFNGGEAIIGMHGTNEPESIGDYVSSGCIRMTNDVISEIVLEVGLPLGTPVYISDEIAPLDSV